MSIKKIIKWYPFVGQFFWPLLFSAFISQMVKVSVQLRPLLFHLFTVFIATAKIKWQNDGDDPYFVHYRALPHSLFSLSLSLFSTFFFLSLLLPFTFLAWAFTLLVALFSNRKNQPESSSSGECDRRTRFLLLPCYTSDFRLANPKPDKAQFCGNFVDSL